MTTIQRASFDVFDTLVERPFVRPSDLFTLVARHCPPRGLAGRWVPYRILRTGAEFLARCLHPGEEDIGMGEIFRVLGWAVPNAEALKAAELAAEQRLCQLRPKGLALFRQMQAEGLRPVVISDMYLPASFILELLERRGLHPYGVYVSSEAGLRKGTGHLFQYVCQQEATPPDAWVHVGDHPVSDQARPRELGMQVVPVEPPRPHVLGTGLLGSVVAALVARQECTGFWQQLGAELVGPMVLGYTRWIAEQVRSRGLVRVLFVGRDGYLLKLCFDRLHPEIETQYLEISRRAMLLPSFRELDSTAEYLLFEGQDLTVENFFIRIGMSRPMEIPDGPLRPVRAAVSTWLHVHKAEFLAQCAMERGHMLTYLAGKGFQGEVGLVDIGWHGTIQKALEDLALGDGIPVVLHGMYFGTSWCKVNHADAYFFQNNRPLRDRALVDQSIALFEFLFTEPVASVEQVHCHSGVVVLERSSHEPEDAIAFRRELGHGAMNFLDAFLEWFKVEEFRGEEFKTYIRSALSHYLAEPGPEALAIMGRLTHSVGFGQSTIQRMVEPAPIGATFRSLSRGYILSCWRIGYVSTLPHRWRGLFRQGHVFLYSRPGQLAHLILQGAILRYLRRRSLKEHRRSLQSVTRNWVVPIHCDETDCVQKQAEADLRPLGQPDPRVPR